MTKLVVKVWLKKVWIWFKASWQFLLCLLLSLLLIFTRKKVDLTNLFRDVSSRKRKEMNEIETAHQQQVRLQQEAAERAVNAMKEIEEVYRERRQKLDRKRRKQIQREIEKVKHNPEALAQRLAELTGMTYVPRED